MKAGEVYLAQFPFGDVPGMKLRPVLLLAGPVGGAREVLVAYISSVVPGGLLPSDLMLDPASPGASRLGLKALSVLRLHKLATIHGSGLARMLGELDASQLKLAQAKLGQFLAL